MNEKIRSFLKLDPRLLIFVQETLLIFLLAVPLVTYVLLKLIGSTNNIIFLVAMICSWGVSLITIYEAFIEPRLISVRQHELEVKGLSKKFRIVFFTDMHVGPFKKKGFVKRVVKKVNSLRADLIFIGGDFTTAGAIRPGFLTPLEKLEANYPVVAVLGNHDYNMNFSFDASSREFARKVKSKLTSLNIKVLKNQSFLFDFGEEKLNVVGIDDLWAGNDDVDLAFSNVDLKWPVIVLVHNLDLVKKLKGKKADILLAGHTHGLNLRLSLCGIIDPPLRITELGSKYKKGFNRYKGIPMYVSTGIGSVFNGVRFFKLPEIVIFDLK